MRNKKMYGIAALLFIFLMGPLSGQITVKGYYCMPTAGESIRYRAVMTITPEYLEIECDRKLFQRFNEPRSPKFEKLRIKRGDIDEIKVYDDEISIKTDYAYTMKYRSFFHLHFYYRSFFEGVVHLKLLLVFYMDNPAGVQARVSEPIEPVVSHACQVIKKFQGAISKTVCRWLSP